MNRDTLFNAGGKDLLSMFPVSRQKKTVLDLVVAFGIGIVLFFLNLVVNFGESLHKALGDADGSAGTRLLLNVLLVWLALLLWVAFVRWRDSNRKAIELDAVLASISPDSLLVVNRDRQIQLCNRSVERMFGYTMSELIGKQTDVLYSDRRRTSAAREVYDALAKDGFHIGYAEGLHRDGRHVPLEIISGEVRGGQGAVLLLRDISERVQAEEERREVERRLQQRQKLESIGVLAGGIAHDFNNLLMVVLGNAELIGMRVAPDSDEYGQLQDIKSAADRAGELCQQMLAYAGKGRFIIGPVNLTNLVKGIGKFLEITVSKKVTCRYHLDEDVPLIEGDATQIRQIVMNLLTNASDAIGDEEGTIHVTVGARNCDDAFLRTCDSVNRIVAGRYVFLTVSDTGCGMDAQTRSRMFEPFFSTKMKGRGLGMASVHGIIRAHDGAVRIETAPGQGTTFDVFLPASETMEEGAVVEKTAKGWTGEGTILLVDDEAKLLSLTGRMLNLIGFDVITARDGEEAVEMFDRHQREIRCVLLDMTMPRKGGAEVLNEIRELNKTVPVLLESGYPEGSGRFSLNDASVGFIEKPYQLDRLREAIRQLMEEGRNGTDSNCR